MKGIILGTVGGYKMSNTYFQSLQILCSVREYKRKKSFLDGEMRGIILCSKERRVSIVRGEGSTNHTSKSCEYQIFKMPRNSSCWESEENTNLGKITRGI